MNSTPKIIRPVEHKIDDGDPPIIAMRNVRYVPSGGYMRSGRSIVFYCIAITCCVAIFWTLVQMFLADSLMSARVTGLPMRIMAGSFFLLLIFWFTVEAGWGGGDKYK